MKPFVHSGAPRNSIASVYFRNGICKAPPVNHRFLFCLLCLDSFLYISYVELADTGGKKAYQEFLIAKYFLSGESKFCVLFVSPNEKLIFGKCCLRYCAILHNCAGVFWGVTTCTGPAG